MGKLFINDTVIDNNDNEWIEKNKGYLAYIDNHISNIDEAYGILFKKPFTELDAQELEIPLEQLKSARNRMKNDLDNHDISKYSDEEFEGYRAKYFMTTEEQNNYDNDLGCREAVDKLYEEAWKHHYLYNDHHPEHWKWVDKEENGRYKIRETPRSEALEMPLYAILHMLVDWQAMSIKFNNTVYEWYNSDKSLDERTCMNPDTKKIVDKFVEWIKNHKQ